MTNYMMLEKGIGGAFLGLSCEGALAFSEACYEAV